MVLGGREILDASLRIGINYLLFLLFPMKALNVNILKITIVSHRKTRPDVGVRAMKINVKSEGNYYA